MCSLHGFQISHRNDFLSSALNIPLHVQLLWFMKVRQSYGSAYMVDSTLALNLCEKQPLRPRILYHMVYILWPKDGMVFVIIFVKPRKEALWHDHALNWNIFFWYIDSWINITARRSMPPAGDSGFTPGRCICEIFVKRTKKTFKLINKSFCW